jgi:hypothetical protein
MFRHIITSLPATLLLLAAPALAGSYSYMIDHGTPGVIASNSKMARIVIIGSGDCAAVPYNIIADGVKSMDGVLKLTRPVSFPLDFTTVTLSCSADGIKADVSKQESGLFRGD